MLEFIFIYVSVCTSFGVILHEENESRTSMSDKEKLEFQLGFPYKYHEDDFLTSKEAHSRINKIYQYIMFLYVYGQQVIGPMPMPLHRLPPPNHSDNNPLVQVMPTVVHEDKIKFDIHRPESNASIYQLALQYHNDEISITEVNTELLSISGGGSPFKMAIVVFVYYLSRSKGFSQAEAFTFSSLVTRTLITNEVRKSVSNWDNNNIRPDLNPNAHCQHRKQKSTSLDAGKSNQEVVVLNAPNQQQQTQFGGKMANVMMDEDDRKRHTPPSGDPVITIRNFMEEVKTGILTPDKMKNLTFKDQPATSYLKETIGDNGEIRRRLSIINNKSAKLEATTTLTADEYRDWQKASEDGNTDFHFSDWNRDPQTMSRNNKAIRETKAMIQAHKEGIIDKQTVRRPLLHRGEKDTDFISTDGQTTYEIRSVVKSRGKTPTESAQDCVDKIESAYESQSTSLADHYLFDLSELPANEKRIYQEQIKKDLVEKNLENKIDNFDFIFGDE